MLNKYNFPGKLPDDPEWYWEEEPEGQTEEAPETVVVSLEGLVSLVDKINEKAMSLVNMLHQDGLIDEQTFKYYSDIFKGGSHA
jgi:hypothetical protein